MDDSWHTVPLIHINIQNHIIWYRKLIEKRSPPPPRKKTSLPEKSLDDQVPKYVLWLPVPFDATPQLRSNGPSLLRHCLSFGRCGAPTSHDVLFSTRPSSMFKDTRGIWHGVSQMPVWCFDGRNFQRVNNNEAYTVIPNALWPSWIPSLSHTLLYHSISPQKQDHSMITQSCSLHAWTEFLVNNTQLWTTTIRATQIVDESQGGFVFSSQLHVLGDFNKKCLYHEKSKWNFKFVWWENKKSSLNPSVLRLIPKLIWV